MSQPSSGAPVRSILATDCGSTTTKAILILQQPDGGYRLAVRGEAPTTVEAPFDDVTVGVVNAVREVEELSGRKLLGSDGKPTTPMAADGSGVDLYLSTSSAGGGLQMTVAGVVKAMSAESAQRAALGAGAIIIDVIAVDDGRKEYQRVERLRQLRPDMILMSGGTDGGTVNHLVELAEMLVSADPRPRLGIGLKLPVIYAGNRDAYAPVHELLEERVALRQVDNLRPTLDRENLLPAREAIHDLFLEHVMQQAPGYSKLSGWTSSGIMSTPNAVGKIMETIARQREMNVLGVDIGGATTDVFSVFGGTFNRTVSANLGMSYSICNVLTEAGAGNINRWLPFEVSQAELRNQLRNKMIRPTTIPQQLSDLQIEQAVSREALRLAFDHHKSLARGLTGTATEKNIGNIFGQAGSGQTLVRMMELDMIVGSGGVLSHAPRRAQAALMMMDAYQPEGVTLLTVDSIFMMPQLGVLTTVQPDAATQVFERDCLVYLGACIAPVGVGKAGEHCITVTVDGTAHAVNFGDIQVLPLGFESGDEGEPASREALLSPARNFDVGAGKGRELKVTVKGGTVGVIIDARGRPLQLPNDSAARIASLRAWMTAMGIPLSGKA
ncbi:MAG: glutamate mutase L [Armatimonadetes bacterium]|nr:glutamate mutase L [Armatimonadota bacterium]MDE2207342.1 glutamate mutase L [Armatimonadota bacterium]